MNQEIILKSRPKGKPTNSDFEINKIDEPQLKEGEVLLETQYISVDPYLRGRMRDEKSYIEAFKLNEPLSSALVVKVLESKNDSFKEGDYLTGMLPWKKRQVSKAKGLRKIDEGEVPLSAYLGILGMTGLTAYFGLTHIGEPKKGETIVVSGAAGAVGSTVGQIAKIKGLKTIGIAGSEEKIEMIKNKFGYDVGINYKSTETMSKAIKEAAPNGVDVYYDNVGGEVSDGVLVNINQFARIINCGAISLYNDTEIPTGPRVEPLLIKNSAKMQGFIVSNYEDEFGEGIKQLATWLKEGKLKFEETIVEGFENTPQAFIDLFDGKNKGKMIVKI
ncbi:NADP-dependent oxidoreductase [Mesonia sp. MT50]|uniref:NADP-dependent oxidoreductase n=1 Tax=Mesonia profundi TaxID=3070998 RepID=A0ABU1A1H6_9FLAO|nr:NADP-dependent oxidoreductase [Mesonia profundi]MDQ7917558.1 NADP-dependent oxidoreductase [Mesonia profundi]